MNTPDPIPVRVIGLFAEGRAGGGQITIEGALHELARLASYLVEFEKPLLIAFAVPEGQSASPYTGFLSTLSLRPAINCAAEIYRDGTQLMITGDPETIVNLGGLISRFAKRCDRQDNTGKVPPHIHIEYNPTMDFGLSPSALPLVIVGREWDIMAE
jgi:hypothetical protein